MSSAHSHDHHSHSDHHDHSHGAHHNPRRLLWALLITASFALIELIGGLWSGSLALLSDAGHMFTDSGALLLAVIASRVSQRPANAEKSYGYARAETIGALVNGLAMLGVVLWIFIEAILRLQHPHPINGLGVMVIALLGLIVNMLAAWLLSEDQHNLNSRAAFVHVMGDLLGSVAAIASGAMIYFTGWMPIDPILSLLVCLLILRSTWSVLHQAIDILMNSVPAHIDLHDIGHALASTPGIIEVHDLHIWPLGNQRTALSAHLVIQDPAQWPALLTELKHLLHSHYGIDHTTLQPIWQSKIPAHVIPIRPIHH